MDRNASNRRWLKFLIAPLSVICIVFYLWPRGSELGKGPYAVVNDRDRFFGFARPSEEIVPCQGPSPAREPVDTTLFEAVLPGPNHQPFAGAYDDIALPQTWTTWEMRHETYQSNHPDFDWDEVRWGDLQSRCINSNRQRFDQGQEFPAHFDHRLRMPREGEVNAAASAPRPKTTNGRTAIVLRSWDTFNYTEGDLMYLRSLVSETNLAYGGEYSVFLLVDAKREAQNIWGSESDYKKALEDTVPPEFRDMAVLFNEDLLKAWYPEVNEYRPVLQIYQPLQIFAQFFPEYEHFWQFEMDLRFSGHAGHLLQAASQFSRSEPRKQGYQRASFFYTTSEYGTYENFLARVNDSLNGDDQFYTGIRIPEVPEPWGLKLNPPPTTDPREDDFEWGVGEDADVMVLDVNLNVTLGPDFLFKRFVYNFTQGMDTPRFHSPPAMGRQSWNLLTAVHDAQRLQGLALPGESTMPSFAYYHGMKMSLPPMPIYGRNQDMFGKNGYPTLDFWANGGPPEAENWGTGRGQAVYGFQFLTEATRYKGRDQPYMGPSYRFGGAYAQDLWQSWTTNDPNTYNMVLGKVPALKVYNHQLWMPNMIMHPVKTNDKRPEDLQWIWEGGIPGTRLPPHPAKQEGDEEVQQEPTHGSGAGAKIKGWVEEIEEEVELLEDQLMGKGEEGQP